MNEEWRPVVGHEGRYEVSNLGRVKSFWNQGGRGKSRRLEPKILVQSRGHCGYPVVWLKGKTLLVHRIVAAAFLGPCPPGLQVRHLNGIPSDVRPENLEYGTSKQNSDDRERHGRTPRGECHSRIRITDDQVKELRHLWSNGWSQSRLAKKFDMTPAGAYAIAIGKTRGKTSGNRFLTNGRFNNAKKLSVDLVLNIRAMVSGGSNQTKTAKLFGIDPSLVSRIMSGECWSYVKEV